MRQVITIAPDGAMSGLQRKPGQGLDLTKFGKAAISRASLIEWDEQFQRWYIDVQQDAGRGDVSMPLFREAVAPGQDGHASLTIAIEMLNRLCPCGWQSEIEIDDTSGLVSRARLMFQDYDNAVQVEIAYLDALRLNGKF
jgi:hypothetical protein